MLKELIKSLFYFTYNAWNTLRSSKLIYTLLIPFVSAVYHAITFPVYIDEALTYILFTSTSLSHIISSYPEPNNHVFYSILTYFSVKLPYFSLLIKMRIIPIVTSFLTWIISYMFIKKYYSEKVALIVISITYMCFMSVYYSFLARGYALEFLFFIVCLYAAFNIIKEDSKNRDWLFFSISSILAFFTIPSFLYAFITLNSLIITWNYKNIKQQTVFNCIIALAVILLYLPIIINEGLGALTSNKFVIPSGDRLSTLTNKLIYYPIGLIESIYMQPYWLIIPLIFILSIISIIVSRKNKFSLSLWGIFILLPFFLLLIHNVIPFSRTFHYFAFIIPFLICICTQKYIDQINIKLILFGCILFQSISSIWVSKEIPNNEKTTIKTKELNDKIIESGKTYYMGYSYNCFNHQFEMASKRYNSKNSFYDVDPDSLSAISADTINNYDYVILSISQDETKEKELFYTNGIQRVYKNNLK